MLRAKLFNFIATVKRMEASAHFDSIEEFDIATLLSNQDSLNA